MINNNYFNTSNKLNYKQVIFKMFEQIHLKRQFSNIHCVIIILLNFYLMTIAINFNVKLDNIYKESNYYNLQDNFTFKENISRIFNFSFVNINSTSLNILVNISLFLTSFSVFIIIMIVLNIIYLNSSIIILYKLFQVLSIYLEWILIYAMLLIYSNNFSNPICIVFFVLLIIINYVLAIFNPISSVRTKDILALNNNSLNLYLLNYRLVLLLLSLLSNQNKYTYIFNLVVIFIVIFTSFIVLIKNKWNINNILYCTLILGNVYFASKFIKSVILYFLYMFNSTIFNDYEIITLIAIFFTIVYLIKFNSLLGDTAIKILKSNDMKNINDIIKYINITNLLKKDYIVTVYKTNILSFLFNYCIDSSINKHKRIINKQNIQYNNNLSYLIKNNFSFLLMPFKNKNDLCKFYINNEDVKLLILKFLNEIFTKFNSNINEINLLKINAKDMFLFKLLHIKYLLFDLENYEKVLIEIKNLDSYCNTTISQQFILYVLKEYTNQKLIYYESMDNNDSSMSIYIKHSTYKRNIVNYFKFVNFNNQFNLKKNRNRLNIFNNNLIKVTNKDKCALIANNNIWSYSSIVEVLANDLKIDNLKKLIYSLLEKKEQFWKLFESKEIYVEEIYENGEIYFKLKQEIIESWNDILKASNNNIEKSLEFLYLCFLKYICNTNISEIDLKLWYKDIEYVNKENFKKNRKFVNTVNNLSINNKINKTFSAINDDLFYNRFRNDIGIIVINTNPMENFQTINYVNSNCIGILKYNNKSDLIGKSLNIVLPGDMWKIHEKLISNFIETGISYIQRKTTNFYIVDSNKDIININLVISFLPSLNSNIEGIGLFRESNKKDEIIITNEYGLITNTTTYIKKLLNFDDAKSSSFSNYYIQGYMPEIMQPLSMNYNDLQYIVNNYYQKQYKSINSNRNIVPYMFNNNTYQDNYYKSLINKCKIKNGLTTFFEPDINKFVESVLLKVTFLFPGINKNKINNNNKVNNVNNKLKKLRLKETLDNNINSTNDMLFRNNNKNNTITKTENQINLKNPNNIIKDNKHYNDIFFNKTNNKNINEDLRNDIFGSSNSSNIKFKHLCFVYQQLKANIAKYYYDFLNLYCLSSNNNNKNKEIKEYNTNSIYCSNKILNNVSIKNKFNQMYKILLTEDLSYFTTQNCLRKNLFITHTLLKVSLNTKIRYKNKFNNFFIYESDNISNKKSNSEYNYNFYSYLNNKEETENTVNNNKEDDKFDLNYSKITKIQDTISQNNINDSISLLDNNTDLYYFNNNKNSYHQNFNNLNKNNKFNNIKINTLEEYPIHTDKEENNYEDSQVEYIRIISINKDLNSDALELNKKQSKSNVDLSSSIQNKDLDYNNLESSIFKNCNSNSSTLNKYNKCTLNFDVLKSSSKSQDNDFLDKASVSSNKSSTLDSFLQNLRSNVNLKNNKISYDKNFLSIIASTLLMSGALLTIIYLIISNISYSIKSNRSISNIYTYLLLTSNLSTLQSIINRSYANSKFSSFYNNFNYKKNLYKYVYNLDTNSNKLIFNNIITDNYSDVKNFEAKIIELSTTSLYSIKGNYEIARCCSIDISIKNVYDNTTDVNNIEIDNYSIENTTSNDNVFYRLINTAYMLRYSGILQSQKSFEFVRESALHYVGYLLFYFQGLINNIGISYMYLLYYISFGVVFVYALLIMFCLVKLYYSYKRKTNNNLDILKIFNIINQNESDSIIYSVKQFKKSHFNDYEGDSDFFDKDITKNNFNLMTKVLKISIADVNYKDAKKVNQSKKNIISTNLKDQFDKLEKRKNSNNKDKNISNNLIENDNQYSLNNNSTNNFLNSENKDYYYGNSNANKQLVYKSEITIRFVIEVMFVILFVFFYLIALLVIINFIKNNSVYSILLSKHFYYLGILNNYNHFKLSQTLYNKSTLIYSNIDVKNLGTILNRVTTTINDINSFINNHNDIVDNKIINVLNDNICDNLELKVCTEYKRFMSNSSKSTYTTNKSYYTNSLIGNYNINFVSNSTNLPNEDLNNNSTTDLRYYDDFYLKYFSMDQQNGLFNLIKYNNNLIWTRSKRISYNYSIKNILALIETNNNTKSLLYSLEIINDILHEIHTNISNKYENKFYRIYYILIATSTVIVMLFGLAIFLKLRFVLNRIYKQESLCKILIGEIPDNVIKSHTDILYHIKKMAHKNI